MITAIELVFIYYSLKVRNSFQNNETHLKVLLVGLSWALAESLASFFLYFIMNATGEEFKWEYIQTAIQSNLDLIERIALVALVECYDLLKKSDSMSIHVALIIVGKYLLSGLGFRLFEKFNFEDAWTQLGLKAVYVLVFALVSRIVCGGVFSSKDSYDNFLEAEANKAYDREIRKKRD